MTISNPPSQSELETLRVECAKEDPLKEIDVAYREIVEKRREEALQKLEKDTIKNACSGCWEFNGLKRAFGYGRIHFKCESLGKRMTVATHRLSYMIHKRILTPKTLVCHSCDNPSCWNPEHLYEGDYTKNNRDTVARKRHGNQHFSELKKLHVKQQNKKEV